jgi:hypothetical protein
MKYLILIVVFSFFISSCHKEIQSAKDDIVGEWNWQISHGKDNRGGAFSAVPNGSMPTLVYFDQDGNFENKSACLLPGPMKGNFEIKNLKESGKKTRILILKSHDQRDTFNLDLTANAMILSERNRGGFTGIHEFGKK